MQDLTFVLVVIGGALFVAALVLLLVAVGNPTLKHHLDAQTEAHDTSRGA